MSLRINIPGGSPSTSFQAEHIVVLSTNAFSVGPTLTYNTFYVDTTNSRVGVNTGTTADATLSVVNQQVSGDPAFDVYYSGTADAGAAKKVAAIIGHQTANLADGSDYLGYDGAGNITLRLASSVARSSFFPFTITPLADDGAALGTTALEWSDLFLASGAVINFNNGNATITHSAGVLVFTVAAAKFTGTVSPNADDGSALGSATLEWSDLFLASGAVVNWANGGMTLTHSSNNLTLNNPTASTGITQFLVTSGPGQGTTALIFARNTGTLTYSPTTLMDGHLLGQTLNNSTTSGQYCVCRLTAGSDNSVNNSIVSLACVQPTNGNQATDFVIQLRKTGGTFAEFMKLSSTGLITFANAITTTGANIGTLTNCPHTGNPALYLEVSINGTTYALPAFALT